MMTMPCFVGWEPLGVPGFVSKEVGVFCKVKVFGWISLVLVWFGLDWRDLVWFGVVWFRMIWFS